MQCISIGQRSIINDCAAEKRLILWMIKHAQARADMATIEL
jgi:hypothetical protein